MEARSTIGDCRFKDWRAGNCDRSQILSIAQALSIFLHRIVVWGAIAREPTRLGAIASNRKAELFVIQPIAGL